MRKVCDAERCSIMEKFDERRGTLGGKPARVYGRENEFATVALTDGSCLSVEVSWLTLRRVVDSDRVNVRL